VEDDQHLRELVANVAAAYLSNNNVGTTEVGQVIDRIASCLANVGTVQVVPQPAPIFRGKLTHLQIQNSVTPDSIVSFEDNRPYRTLRRHLTARGMTPEDYRAKWGLPPAYPMTAPNYSDMRSRLAKRPRVGRKKGEPSDRRRAKAPAHS